MAQIDERPESLPEKRARALMIILFRCKAAEIGKRPCHAPSISHAPEYIIAFAVKTRSLRKFLLNKSYIA
jgi:hypothetical protein